MGDQVSQVSEVVGRGGVDLTIPVDEGNSTTKQWELLGLPTLALVGADGSVAEVLAATDLIIERLGDLANDPW